MVRIIEILMFLIVFNLLFQMQEKSRRSISQKGRYALVDLIWRFSENHILFWKSKYKIHDPKMCITQINDFWSLLESLLGVIHIFESWIFYFNFQNKIWFLVSENRQIRSTRALRLFLLIDQRDFSCIWKSRLNTIRNISISMILTIKNFVQLLGGTSRHGFFHSIV